MTAVGQMFARSARRAARHECQRGQLALDFAAPTVPLTSAARSDRLAASAERRAARLAGPVVAAPVDPMSKARWEPIESAARRAKTGDQAAIGELYGLIRSIVAVPLVSARLRASTLVREEAADRIADFAVAGGCLDRWDPAGAPFSAYVRRFAFGEALKVAKRAARRDGGALTAIVADAVEPPTRDEIEFGGKRLAVLAAALEVAGLSELQRDMVDAVSGLAGPISSPEEWAAHRGLALDELDEVWWTVRPILAAAAAGQTSLACGDSHAASKAAAEAADRRRAEMAGVTVAELRAARHVVVPVPVAAVDVEQPSMFDVAA